MSNLDIVQISIQTPKASLQLIIKNSIIKGVQCFNVNAWSQCTGDRKHAHTMCVTVALKLGKALVSELVVSIRGVLN